MKKHLVKASTIALMCAGLANLEHRELVTYWDAIGRVPTYCDGIANKNVKVGTVWTSGQCDKLTIKEVWEHINVIDKHVDHSLSQKQLEAMVYLVHNIGETQFASSSIVKAFNSGNPVQGCALFLWYDAKGIPHGFIHAHGYVINGLVNRRAKEQKLCQEGL